MADKKSKFELAREAQVEQQEEIDAKRMDLIQAQMDHKSIGGVDMTEESVLKVIRKHGGISYPFLQTAYQEKALTAACKALKEKGLIEQVGKKGNVILKLAPAK